MAKDPTPRADALRAQREARYGHLQATAEPPKMGRPVEPKPDRKLIPYAGKQSKGIVPKEVNNKIGRPKGKKT
jgi:hypothetical protein